MNVYLSSPIVLYKYEIGHSVAKNMVVLLVFNAISEVGGSKDRHNAILLNE
jgi:hypothetical protein